MAKQKTDAAVGGGGNMTFKTKSSSPTHGQAATFRHTEGYAHGMDPMADNESYKTVPGREIPTTSRQEQRLLRQVRRAEVRAARAAARAEGC
jgi:hypothetical protein